MDSAEFSSLADDLTAARSFRSATVDYARKSLCRDDNLAETSARLSTVITIFNTVSSAISETYTQSEHHPILKLFPTIE